MKQTSQYKPSEQKETPEGQSPATPELDSARRRPGRSGLVADALREPVARFLDPVGRYVALHDDLPALRREIGREATIRLEHVLGDLCAEVSFCFREPLRTSRDYGDYLRVVSRALDAGEEYFRSDRRVYRHPALTEEDRQQLVRQLRYRLISHLERQLGDLG